MDVDEDYPYVPMVYSDERQVEYVQEMSELWHAYGAYVRVTSVERRTRSA